MKQNDLTPTSITIFCDKATSGVNTISFNYLTITPSPLSIALGTTTETALTNTAGPYSIYIDAPHSRRYNLNTNVVPKKSPFTMANYNLFATHAFNYLSYDTNTTT